MIAYLQFKYRDITPGKHASTIGLPLSLCTISVFNEYVEPAVKAYCSSNQYTFRSITDLARPNKDKMRKITFTYDIP